MSVNQTSYGDYLRFRELAFTHSGLYFPENRRVDLELGVQKALLDSPNSIDNLDDYYRLLQETDNPVAQAEMERLINALTVGETYFFRNNAQIEALGTRVLPALIKSRRETAVANNSAPQLNVWSAGCASGEEPYSLAILLRELIPDIEQWNLRIAATDINWDALERAREATYSEWSFRELRARALRPLYFSPEGKRYRLCDEIREMVHFSRHNLVEDDFASAYADMDLIICRNVTIYFAPSTTQRLAAKFYRALRHRGWLLVGHAEPSTQFYGAFETQTFPGAIFYRKNEALASKNKQIKAQQSPPPDSPSANGRLPPVNPAAFSPIAALKNDLSQMPAAYHPHIYVSLARAYADQGEWEEARASCRKALEQDTLLGDAYFILALIEEHQGELTEAITHLKKVVYLDQKRPFAYFNLGMLYNKLGQSIQAQRALNNAQNLLTAYDPTAVVPDSGGVTAQRLLNAVARMQK